jgi:hypothetical protein
MDIHAVGLSWFNASLGIMFFFFHWCGAASCFLTNVQASFVWASLVLCSLIGLRSWLSTLETTKEPPIGV